MVVRTQLYAGSSVERDLFDEALNGLKVFDGELSSRGKAFFGGDKPGMLDLMIWPWCERADVLRILRGQQFVIPPDRFRRLVRTTPFPPPLFV